MYVKLIDNVIVEAPVNNLEQGIINYNLDIPRLLADGYKLYVEIVKPITNRHYHIGYAEYTATIEETIVYDETQEEADARCLLEAKENKIQENDRIRDEAILQGVEYRTISFDSDTDQKVNLLATIETLPEGQTVIWFGMDNQPLECTKQDLINIGLLITELHTFCWTRNAEIKAEISNASTIAEVEEIDISYEREVE